MQYFLFVYNTKVPKWNLKKEIAHLPIIYSVEEDNKKYLHILTCMLIYKYKSGGFNATQIQQELHKRNKRVKEKT